MDQQKAIVVFKFHRKGLEKFLEAVAITFFT
jgi:hypothetical protein